MNEYNEIEVMISARRTLSVSLRGLTAYVQQLESANISKDPDLVEPLVAIANSINDMVSLTQERLPEDQAHGMTLSRELDDGGWHKFERKFIHDLRNPLGVALGYSELLEETLEEICEEEGGVAWMESLRESVIIFNEQLHHLNKLLEGVFPQRLKLEGHKTTLVPMSETPRHHGRASAPRRITDLPNVNLAPTLTLTEIQTAISKYQHEVPRVLVIDDKQSNRELLCSMLKREGLLGEEAASAAEALERLENQTYDLILLDLVMPEVTGYDLLLQLKSSPRWQQLPVLIISGDNEVESAIRCIEVGAEDFLMKPFNRVLLKARIGACIEKKRLVDKMTEQNTRYKSLLNRILPAAVVQRLDRGEKQIADRFESTSILFSDLVGFTRLSSRLAPSVLIETLDRVFSEFDVIAERCGVEKIKTIGDAYMAAAGLPIAREDHADALVQMGLKMIESLGTLREELGLPLEMRIGIHSGPVAAGIIGENRFLYDVWGDTVNLASRLEASGHPGKVHISQETATALSKQYHLTSTGGVHLKGKGLVESYFIIPGADRDELS